MPVLTGEKEKEMKTLFRGVLSVGARGFLFNGGACFVAGVIMALNVWFTGGPSIDLIPSFYALFISLFFFGVGIDLLSIQQILEEVKAK